MGYSPRPRNSLDWTSRWGLLADLNHERAGLKPGVSLARSADRGEADCDGDQHGSGAG
jgi:hypothetical protein